MLSLRIPCELTPFYIIQTSFSVASVAPLVPSVAPLVPSVAPLVPSVIALPASMSGADKPHRALRVEVVKLSRALGAALSPPHVAQSVKGPHVWLDDLATRNRALKSEEGSIIGQCPDLFCRIPLCARNGLD